MLIYLLHFLVLISHAVHASPFTAVAVVQFVTHARKMVEILSNFAIFALKQFRKVVKAYHEAKDEVRREKHDRGPRVRGRAPRVPAHRGTPRSDDRRAQKKRTKGDNQSGKLGDRTAPQFFQTKSTG